MEPPQVTARVFKAVQTVDVEALSKLPDTELRPVLASLGMANLVLDFLKNGLEDFMLEELPKDALPQESIWEPPHDP